MPVVEEMKSLYKVYKSMQVDLGEKKELTFIEKDFKNSSNKPDNNHREEKKDSKEKKVSSQDVEKKLQEAEEKARNIIEQAKKEAKETVEKADTERKEVQKQAENQGFEKGYQEGHQEGFQAGEVKGYEEEKNYIQEAKDLKEQAYKEREDLAKELEESIIDLSIKAIEKVIDKELEKDHELLLNLIENGLKKSTYTETLVIRVSEGDFDLIDVNKNKIYMMTEGIDEIKIKVDHSFKKNEIIIETHSGIINAGLKTQIEQIHKAFKDLLQSEGI